MVTVAGSAKYLESTWPHGVYVVGVSFLAMYPKVRDPIADPALRVVGLIELTLLLQVEPPGALFACHLYLQWKITIAVAS